MPRAPEPDALSQEQLRHLARLALLELDDAELAELGAELGRILGYVALMAEADLTGVEPSAQAPITLLECRPDVASPSLPRERVLGGAPLASERGFELPAFAELHASEGTEAERPSELGPAAARSRETEPSHPGRGRST
jgi:aspartyl-tRNA(Asn)/glutamyl-tRNA(Gln) amidotransferase subunit C